jgi:hypothetical protein
MPWLAMFARIKRNYCALPATSAGDPAIFFKQSDPETERSVTDGELERARYSHLKERCSRFEPIMFSGRYT